MHLSEVHADMIGRIDIMEEEVREPFASPEAQGWQIEQPLDMRVLAHQVPLFREDKGEMQEGRRRQIPAEQKKVCQDMRGLEIKDGHEEAKPNSHRSPKTSNCAACLGGGERPALPCRADPTPPAAACQTP